ncbi:hypothetical protein BEN74_01555 [Acinetobacter sp. WCHAc010034]|uniref:hypothetical protein n=1 Tax=Acinetobacter sp. WCHAc010034 TaxID=1879049 RepID=UPI000839E09B|nr:hypothetical protein [Acinetobacter sp. WCHAc010034]AYA01698.1 hypothetical protein BEN74_01555 [Acinetobacter sp. WCHAc010034]
MSETGRKTKRIKFNLFERGRKHSGRDRANVDMKEMIKTGTLYGYNGHEIRRRYGMLPPESTLIDCKVVYLEPAFRTVEAYAEENGDVTHVEEFFDNEAGEYARKQYLAHVGGFSSAQNYRRAGVGLVPVGFFGFDYVMQPNYTTNVGDGQLFDGLVVPEQQDGLIACFDSATDTSQLAPSEAMIAHLLEQQILRDFDSIHSQLQLHQFNEQALDQVGSLSDELAKRDRRAALQAQRAQVSEVRSFDSACDEADELLTASELARLQMNGEKAKAEKMPLYRWHFLYAAV